MEHDDAIRNTQTQLTVILLGLVMGVAALGGIALYVGPIMDDGEVFAVLRWVAVVLAIAEFSAALYLYKAIGGRILRAESIEERIQAVRGRVIVAAAMLEGAALFAGVVILLTGPSWHVVPAFALFLAGLGLIFPSRESISRAVGRPEGRPSDKYT